MMHIIALFDDDARARAAQDELTREGFKIEDVDTYTQKSGSAPSTGFWDKVKGFFGADEDIVQEGVRRGGTLLGVTVEDDRMADRAAEIIDRHAPYDVDRRAEEWRKSGWQAAARPATMTGAPASIPSAQPGSIEERGDAARGERRIPVVEEKVKVGKRVLGQGGVRVYSRVIERPIEEEVRLREERVSVERRPADRPAGEEAFREQTVEVTESREEPVVQKEARVVEEVVVGKDVRDRTEKVQDTVRRTEVQVEPIEAEAREDFDRYGPAGGLKFEEYRPAHDIGRELGERQDYQNQEWAHLEPIARQSWDKLDLGPWDRFKDAIRNGFERARGKLAASHQTPDTGM